MQADRVGSRAATMRWEMSGWTRVAGMAGHRRLLTPASVINSTEVRLKLPQHRRRTVQGSLKQTRGVPIRVSD